MMLRAIGEGRRQRVAACTHWASTPAGRLLQKYEEEWARFRDADIIQRRKKRSKDGDAIGVPAVLGRVTQRKGAEVATDRALFVELRKVHAQLKRIVDARHRLEHSNDLRDRLGPKPLSRRQAARAAMEEDRALLYSHNYHYIADVLDPDGHGWVRYDANSNGAIGWDVGAPTGRVQHEHHSYYAILLAYVRVRGGPSDLAQS